MLIQLPMLPVPMIEGEIIVDPSVDSLPIVIFVLTNNNYLHRYTNATEVNVMVFTGLSAGNYNRQITDANGLFPNNDPETWYKPAT